MRWWSAAVAMAVLAASGSAVAQAPQPRRGAYASGALGFGAAFVRQSVDNEQTTAGRFTFEVRGALGYAPLDGLALAVDGRVLLQPDLVAPVLGGLVDWYPAPRGPWHVELGLGYLADVTPGAAGANVAGSGRAASGNGQGDNTGLLGHAGVGYAVRAGRVAFSPTLDVYRARETAGGARLDAYGALLELTVVRL